MTRVTIHFDLNDQFPGSRRLNKILLADLKDDIFKVACAHSSVTLTAKLGEKLEEQQYEVVTNFTLSVRPL